MLLGRENINPNQEFKGSQAGYTTLTWAAEEGYEG